MAKEKFIVEITPHYYFFGLPSEPDIHLSVQKIESTFWFPISCKRVFDTNNRDLFTCVSDCNKFFENNNIDKKRVEWPECCRYITDYKE